MRRRAVAAPRCALRAPLALAVLAAACATVRRGDEALLAGDVARARAEYERCSSDAACGLRLQLFDQYRRVAEASRSGGTSLERLVAMEAVGPRFWLGGFMDPLCAPLLRTAVAETLAAADAHLAAGRRAEAEALLRMLWKRLDAGRRGKVPPLDAPDPEEVRRRLERDLPPLQEEVFAARLERNLAAGAQGGAAAALAAVKGDRDELVAGSPGLLRRYDDAAARLACDELGERAAAAADFQALLRVHRATAACDGVGAAVERGLLERAGADLAAVLAAKGPEAMRRRADELLRQVAAARRAPAVEGGVADLVLREDAGRWARVDDLLSQGRRFRAAVEAEALRVPASPAIAARVAAVRAAAAEHFLAVSRRAGASATGHVFETLALRFGAKIPPEQRLGLPSALRSLRLELPRLASGPCAPLFDREPSPGADPLRMSAVLLVDACDYRVAASATHRSYDSAVQDTVSRRDASGRYSSAREVVGHRSGTLSSVELTGTLRLRGRIEYGWPGRTVASEPVDVERQDWGYCPRDGTRAAPCQAEVRAKIRDKLRQAAESGEAAQLLATLEPRLREFEGRALLERARAARQEGRTDPAREAFLRAALLSKTAPPAEALEFLAAVDLVDTAPGEWMRWQDPLR